MIDWRTPSATRACNCNLPVRFEFEQHFALTQRGSQQTVSRRHGGDVSLQPAPPQWCTWRQLGFASNRITALMVSRSSGSVQSSFLHQSRRSRPGLASSDRFFRPLILV